MIPFFFGRSATQLYGAYDSPAENARDHGIVLCPAIADEYLFAHPTYRLIARQLSAIGYHVLRFDYFGTGDSAGSFTDGGQRQWLEDIRTAVAELKDVGQVSRVSLIGLRYGAALAALAARGRSDVDQLVLWDPVDDGRRFLQEIGATAASTNEVIDACGVAITPSLRADIESVTLESFGALPKTLLVASGNATAGAEAIHRQLQASRADCVLERTLEEPVWRERRVGAGAMSVATARAIVAWLT